MMTLYAAVFERLYSPLALVVCIVFAYRLGYWSLAQFQLAV